MFPRLPVCAALAFACITGWSDNVSSNSAFVFIENRPPSTSEDRAAKSAAIYLNDRGLVQQYSLEDYQIIRFREASLPVDDIFRILSGLTLKSLSGKPNPDDPMQMPSQAHPGHLHIMVRQQDGVEFMWSGAPANAPPALQKIARDAEALALKAKPAPSASGIFLRANVLNAEQLAEYRAGNLLKTIKNQEEIDSTFGESMNHPFQLVPVPAGANPFSAFSIKGAPDQVPILFKNTGFEVNRYSLTPPSLP